MTNGENDLNDARRFAIEHMRDANRVFWTRVGALLTVNSLLVAGFAVLYIYNDNGATPLLITISVCGCLIQFTWPIFALSSYPNFKYLRELLSHVENNNKEDVRNFWTYYKTKCDDWYCRYFCKPLEIILLVCTCPLWLVPKLLLLLFKYLRKSSDYNVNQNTKGHNSRLTYFLEKTVGSFPAGIIATGIFFCVFFAIWIYATMAAFDC